MGKIYVPLTWREADFRVTSIYCNRRVALAIFKLSYVANVVGQANGSERIFIHGQHDKHWVDAQLSSDVAAIEERFAALESED